MSDLMERLRKWEAHPHFTHDEEILTGLAGEAADEIARLTAELKQPWEVLAETEIKRRNLAAEVEAYHAGCVGRDVEIVKLEDRVRDLQAVVDAARDLPHRHYPHGKCPCAVCVALRALDGEP